MINFPEFKRRERARVERDQQDKVKMWLISFVLFLIYFFLVMSKIKLELNPWYFPLVIPAVALFFAVWDLLDENDEWFPLWYHRATLITNIAAVMLAVFWFVFFQ